MLYKSRNKIQVTSQWMLSFLWIEKREIAHEGNYAVQPYSKRTLQRKFVGRILSILYCGLWCLQNVLTLVFQWNF